MCCSFDHTHICVLLVAYTVARMHWRTRPRVRCFSASRLLNFTDVSTWFLMPPDGSRFNLRACKFENFPGGACPQTPLVGRVLHVRLAPPPPTVHLLLRPCYWRSQFVCSQNYPTIILFNSSSSLQSWLVAIMQLLLAIAEWSIGNEAININMTITLRVFLIRSVWHLRW